MLKQSRSKDDLGDELILTSFYAGDTMLSDPS